MKVEDIVLKRAKYKMNYFRINIPGRDPFEVDRSLMGSIRIEKDFDNYTFPFFTVDVAVPNSVARQMRKNNADLTVSMDIQMGLFEERDDSEKGVTWSNGINGEFYVLFPDTDPELNIKATEQFEKMQGTYNNDGMGFTDYTIYQLLLYKKDELFKSQTVVNKILTSVNLITAVAYLLGQSGLKNFLVSPPTNYKNYKEFKLVPITTKQQLERICNGYGLHSKGSVIFFDIDRNYILERSAKCTAWATNEITKVYLANFTSDFVNSVAKVGCYTNSKEKYYLCNVMEDSVNANNMALLTSAVEGSKVMHINEIDGSAKTVTANVKASKFANTNVTKVLSTAVGDDTSNSYAAISEEGNLPLNVALEYVDLKILKPNKEFIFTSDDASNSKYNGSYRMSKCDITLMREGAYLIPKVDLELKK